MKLSDTLITSILALLIGWNIISYIREPKDVVISYKQLKAMETEVSTLMSSVTKGLNEPKDALQLTKNWGVSSLTYYYDNYITNIEIVENNIQSQTYWKEIPSRVQDDPNIFKSYCYDDISLNLSKNRIGVLGDFTVRIAWQKDSHCWKQARDNVE